MLFARTGTDLLVVHRVIRIEEQDGERLFELQGGTIAIGLTVLSWREMC